MKRKRTAGTWDPREGCCYFLASNRYVLVNAAMVGHKHLLTAVNELRCPGDMDCLRSMVTGGNSVFIDSGVFFLANEHADKHGLTMNQALSMPPEQIDGYTELFARYVQVAKELGDRSWGYVEIDLGGRDNKIKTRAKLEAIGLRPIPVYHPLNDGWDYFDELASQYDRICFGNVVMAERELRKRLLATAWERRRKYPNLWIHLLGFTPNELCNAYPINSADSSTWVAMVRWPDAHKTRVSGQPFSGLHRNFMYGDEAAHTDPNGYIKAWKLCAYEAAMAERNWRASVAEYNAAGFDTKAALR